MGNGHREEFKSDSIEESCYKMLAYLEWINTGFGKAALERYLKQVNALRRISMEWYWYVVIVVVLGAILSGADGGDMPQRYYVQNRRDYMKDKIEVTKEEIKEVMYNARKQFRKTNLNGPFGHNIAGLILRDVAKKIGTKYANRLIFEHDLDELGIMPVGE